MFHKHYAGKVVHVIGGISEYIGELADHPMNEGEFCGWIRIKNPCLVQLHTDEAGSIKIRLMRIGGVQGNYRDRVDMHFPKDTFLEIRELMKSGTLCQAYRNELERPVLDKIIDPNAVDFKKITALHGNH